MLKYELELLYNEILKNKYDFNKIIQILFLIKYVAKIVKSLYKLT